MINIKFKPEEKIMTDIQEEFVKLLDEDYTNTLEMNHYELWKKCGKLFNPIDWKEFRMHSKVDDWYTDELLLIAKQKSFKLLNKAGDNRSVGEAQALAQAMNYIDKHEYKQTSEVKIIYCFVPLTKDEEAAKNVKVLQTIPTEIENALTRYNRS